MGRHLTQSNIFHPFPALIVLAAKSGPWSRAMNMWNFIFITFKAGLLFSLLAVLAERLLIINGFARGNTIGLIFAAFLLAIFKQLVDSNSSLYSYILFIVVVGPLGVNRFDLNYTLQKGRWWWKSTTKDENL